MNHVTRTLAAAGLAAALSAGAASAQVNLSAETSSPGNSPHLATLHLAEVASEMGIASLQVQEGQTLTNSVLNVAEGRTDISPAPLVLTFLLQAGRGPFAAQGEAGAELAANLRALYPYNAGGFGLFALESEGIDEWTDIEGRTVFNGPPRGAALVNARQAIQMATGGFTDGDQYTGLQANWGQLATILVDGSVDAFVIPLTFPSERVVVAQGAGDVAIVSTPKAIYESEAFQKLIAAPGNVPIEIAWEDMGYGEGNGVRLISEDGVFRGFGTAFADVVHKDMDFELAKALTAAHLATLDELKAKAPYARNVNFGVVDAKASGFCGAMPLKYHPGAIAAWEEAGYTVPDCAKPE